MMRSLPAGLALFLATALTLTADDDLRRYQQALRDQGFYYGQVDGKASDETNQAIRRFQIRNALPVNGNLDAATKKAIDSNVDGASPSRPASTPPPAAPRRPVNPDNPDTPVPSEVIIAPTPKPAKPAAPRPSATPPARGRYDNDPPPRSAATPAPKRPEADPAARPPARPPVDAAPVDEIRRPGEAPTARPASPIFIGGPYESAPPFVQSSIIGRVQIALAQQGFYRGETSGRVGPQTQQAVRDFQASTGLRMSGRLDAPTLQALGIEPPVYGRPSADRPSRRAPRPREDAPYLGRGVYEGRIVDGADDGAVERPRRRAPGVRPAPPTVIEEDEEMEEPDEPGRPR